VQKHSVLEKYERGGTNVSFIRRRHKFIRVSTVEVSTPSLLATATPSSTGKLIGQHSPERRADVGRARRPGSASAPGLLTGASARFLLRRRAALEGAERSCADGGTGDPRCFIARPRAGSAAKLERRRGPGFQSGDGGRLEPRMAQELVVVDRRGLAALHRRPRLGIGARIAVTAWRHGAAPVAAGRGGRRGRGRLGACDGWPASVRTVGGLPVGVAVVRAPVVVAALMIPAGSRAGRPVSSMPRVRGLWRRGPWPRPLVVLFSAVWERLRNVFCCFGGLGPLLGWWVVRGPSHTWLELVRVDVLDPVIPPIDIPELGIISA